jgi:hypothetical protein
VLGNDDRVKLIQKSFSDADACAEWLLERESDDDFIEVLTVTESSDAA